MKPLHRKEIKMDITRENYEAFFIDYLEGTLDEQLVNQFIDFLHKNPDLKAELALYEPISLAPETTVFAPKETLYKTKFDVESEFNNAAVAQLEGDISPETEQQFAAYLASHPEKQKEIEAFGKTILKADTRVVFPHKNKLYKKPAKRIVLFWAGRVAAILLLAFAIYSLLDKNAETVSTESHFAQRQEIIEKHTLPTPEIPTEIQDKEETASEIATPETTPKPQPIKALPQKPATITNPINENRANSEIEKTAPLKIPVEVPQKMNRLMASVEVPQPVANLAQMHLKYIEIVIEQPTADDERLLANVVKEKTGIDKLSLDKIKKAGLNLFSNFTKDNLNYETDSNGKITEINYDSRLLAFSIPTGREKGSK